MCRFLLSFSNKPPGTTEVTAVLVLLLLITLSISVTTFAKVEELSVNKRAATPDEEDCMICHRYPGLARIDQKTGKLRLFYVSPALYGNSVHENVLCRYCHQGLDVIPHNNIKKVDCSNKCHIKEPSTEREFSHKNIYERLIHSVHSSGTPTHKKKFPQDFPRCPDCHVNQVYKPVADLKTMRPGINKDALRRCLGCHTDKKWATRFYQHFSHRMHRAKSAKQLVDLCLACHSDPQKMVRHGLEPVSGYKDTFHWKAVLYGDPNAPDCLSCHAPQGFGIDVHSMEKVTNKKSPVYPKNRPLTCANTYGTQQCHPGATYEFAMGKVHKLPVTLTGETGLVRPAKSRALAPGVKLEQLSSTEKMQRRIYYLVKVLYTLLITMVVGGMIIHQALDFYRVLKK